MRRGLALLILSIFLLQGVSYAAGDVFQGHAEFDDEYTELDNKLFTGKKETLDNLSSYKKSRPWVYGYHKEILYNKNL